MDRVEAEKIHVVISAMFEHANEVLFVVNNSKDLDLRKKVQRMLGTMVVDLDLEVLEPIYKKFPDLRPPDMEEVEG